MVLITTGESYTPDGGSDVELKTQTAYLSDHAVKIDNARCHMTGFNIGGSNYYRLRDLAIIMDFGVDYDGESGSVIINTDAECQPEEISAAGSFYESDVPLFIDEMPLVSYYTASSGAYNEEYTERLNVHPRLIGVWIDAPDLENYGFDVEHGDTINITYNSDKEFAMLDGITVNSAPSETAALENVTAVYMDGERVTALEGGGHILIPAAALYSYCGTSSANYDWSGNMLKNRINFDLTSEKLNEVYALTDDTGLLTAELSTSFTDFLDLDSEYAYIRIASESEGIVKVLAYLSTREYRWFGYADESGRNGLGIELLKEEPTGNSGLSYAASWLKRKGIFENGEFVDGVEIQSPYKMAARSANGSVAEVSGYRIEGAHVDGYRRESVITFAPMGDNFRFCYRAVCEGTVENGEYCGYYRRYDDDGTLIFEGEYAEYVEMYEE
ncbi:MAG: hypothetical protein LIO59_01830 [Oscillospiraceae bacterium]|nr:hypothetical protein [Oscillospiraceae bacterium]